MGTAFHKGKLPFAGKTEKPLPHNKLPILLTVLLSRTFHNIINNYSFYYVFQDDRPEKPLSLDNYLIKYEMFSVPPLQHSVTATTTSGGPFLGETP